MGTERFTRKNSYTVPFWCGMHPLDHFDGIGGCWGISYGLVAEQGRDYCRLCTFYRRTAKRVDSFVAMHDAMAGEERCRGKFLRTGPDAAPPGGGSNAPHPTRSGSAGRDA